MDCSYNPVRQAMSDLNDPDTVGGSKRRRDREAAEVSRAWEDAQRQMVEAYHAVQKARRMSDQVHLEQDGNTAPNSWRFLKNLV
jgi:hypothetical protein